MGLLVEFALFQNVGVARGNARNPQTGMEKSNMNFKRLLIELYRDDRGQDLIEYALIASLLAMAAVSALSSLTNKIDNEFNKIGNSL